MTQPGTLNPYGTDLQSLPNPAANGAIDLDPGMVEASGRILLAQSLVRRQTTPNGSVIDSPADGIDVRGWMSQGWTQAQMQAAAGQLKAEILKDERVTNATITLAFTPSSPPGTGTLTITEQITSSYGPFQLTLTIPDLTVAILPANQGTYGQT